MLIYQGAENFRIWTGSELPVELVRPRMEAALKEAAHGALSALAEPALCTRGNWTQISDRAKRVRVVGLSGPARACYLMALLQDLRCPLLVVTPSDAACHSPLPGPPLLCRDSRGELGWEEPPGDTFCVHAFPSWELSPLEPLSPSPEVVGQRLSALAAWAKGRRP